MSPLFGKKCPNCGLENSADAKFCASCGSPLAGRGGKKCGVCGTDNRTDAVFCRECGRRLDAYEDVEVRGNHWSRKEGDFAARVEVSDLPGILSKNLEVETGTQAMIYGNGVPQEILPPGVYTLDSIGQTIKRWLTGVPKTATILLVDAAPVELTIPIKERFTSDPLPLSLSLRLVIEVEDVGKFLTTALRGRERYSLEEFKNYLQPEISAVIDNYLQKRTLQQIVENSATKSELEIAVEEMLRRTFEQYGIKLLSLRTVEFNLEAFDKIKGVKGQYSLLASEGEAQLEGSQKLIDLQNRFDLQKLAEDTSKVELEERKVDVYQRLRQAVLSDKFNEINSKNDFQKFIDNIDHQKLLSEKEKQDLLDGWREEKEDHNRARAFLLAKADVEEKYQLRSIEVKMSNELSVEEQDYAIGLEQKRSEMTLKIEEEKWQAELKKQQALLEFENSKAQTGIDMLIDLKRKKMLIEFEQEEHSLKIRLDEARAHVELEITRLDAEHRREMERLSKLGTLGIEALIAASPVEQGHILQDLRRTELLKGFTDEQILAMATEKNPELGKVFEEKYRAIAEGKADEREREMYEKLLAENRDNQKILLDVQREAMERMQRMSEHDIDAIKDVSSSFAKQGPAPVVIAGAGGGTVVHATRSGQYADDDVKVCPSCGRSVPVSSRFCPYCNNQFKDLK